MVHISKMKKIDRAKQFCQKFVSIFIFFVDGSLLCQVQGRKMEQPDGFTLQTIKYLDALSAEFRACILKNRSLMFYYITLIPI